MLRPRRPEAAVKPGEVWSCRATDFDSRPWYYLVLETDGDGVDLVLLDSDADAVCVPGDQIGLSWADVRADIRRSDRLLWELVA